METPRHRIALTPAALQAIQQRLGCSETYIRRVCSGKVEQRKTDLQRNITRLAEHFNK